MRWSRSALLGFAVAPLVVCTFALVGAGVAASDVGDDRAIGRRALVKIDALPDEEWKAAADAGGDDPGFSEHPECDGLREAERLVGDREVRGPDFSWTDDATGVEYGFEQAVIIFRTKRLAERYVDAYTGPDAVACFQRSLRKGPDSGISLEPDGLARLRGPAVPDLGDAGVAFRFTGRLVSDTGGLPIVFEAFVSRVGRAVTPLSFSTVGALTSVPNTAAIVQVAVDKLTAEL